MKISTFSATTLPDLWFQLVYALLKDDSVGKSVYAIDSGSYVGQKRIEFDYAVMQVLHPGAEPLIPDVPAHLGIPGPVESIDYVHNYAARYLFSDRREANETYTYGSWLARGLDRVREQLRRGRGTNQATVSIGGWLPVATAGGRAEWIDTDDYVDPATGERDPACLRVVDFRLDGENRLHLIVYFRSWDLWGGLPANLAGLQLVKATLADECGAQDGTIIASSKGLHLYDHAFQVAARRVGMEPTVDLEGFTRFVEGRR